MIIFLIIIYIMLALFQVPDLIKKKHWRELGVFSFFLVFSFVLSLLYSLDAKIPSPAKGVQYILDILHLHY